MQLVAWVLLAGLIALAGRQSPIRMCIVVLLLRFAVPSYGGYVITGHWDADVAIHPSTILLLFVLAFTTLEFRGVGRQELDARSGLYFFMAAYFGLYLALTLISRGPIGTAGLINVVGAPMVFYYLVNVARRVDPGATKQLISWFIGASVAESALALVQSIAGAALVWNGGREAPYVRPMGTLDTPLDLGFVLVAAAPLLITLESVKWRIILLMTLGVGIVSSESRTATAAFAVVALAMYFRPAARGLERIIGLSTLFFAVFLALVSGLAAGILYRIQVDDGNSSFERSIAFQYAKQTYDQHIWLGDGWGSTFGLKGSVLEISLENGFLAMGFDVGILATGALVAFILWHARPLISRQLGGSRPAALSVLVLTVLGFLYSGLVTMSAAALVLWLVMALSTSIAHSSDAASVRAEERRLRPQVGSASGHAAERRAARGVRLR